MLAVCVSDACLSVFLQSASLKHASKQLAQEHSKYLELQSDLEEKDGLIKRLHAAQFAHKTKIRKLESQVVDVMKAASGEGGAASEAVVAQYEKARLSVVGLEEALERQREEYELLLGEARSIITIYGQYS